MSSVFATADRNLAKRVTFHQATGYVSEMRALGCGRGLRVIDTAPGSDSSRAPDRFIIGLKKFQGREQYVRHDSIL